MMLLNTVSRCICWLRSPVQHDSVNKELTLSKQAWKLLTASDALFRFRDSYFLLDFRDFTGFPLQTESI